MGYRIRRLVRKVCPVLLAAGLGITLLGNAALAESKPGKLANNKPAAAGAVDLSGLEALSDQFMKGRTGAADPPGTAIVVVQDGRIVFKKGYGFADVEKKLPVDPDQTVFRIGSVTKSFTAAAIMKLADQGKIDLKADVQKYMDGIRLDNPFKTPVTVQDLLKHTTGFQVTVETPDFYNEDLTTSVSLRAFVEKELPPVVREPGTSYMYDNFAYNLLGYIIENVSGMPYEEYLDKNLYQPLGMKNTEAAITKKSLQHLAVGYDVDKKAIRPYRTTPTSGPDGGMLLTADDASHFMLALMNGGMYGKTRVWNEESVRQMLHYQTGIHPAFQDTTYGFENLVEANKNNGQLVIGKGGDVPGFSAYMLMIPERKIGIFLVHNKMGSSTQLDWQWYRMFIDHYFPAGDSKTVYMNTPQQQLKRFEGVYTDLRQKVLLTNVTATGAGELTVEDVFGSHKLKQKEPLLFEDEKGHLLGFKEEKDGTISYLKYTIPVSYAKKSTHAFADVPADSEYAPFIGQLKAMEVIQGDKDGRYQPSKAVTRAEMTSTLIRILGLTLSKSPARFDDIAGSWAEREIETAAEAGLVQGISKKSFAPDKTLTRLDAAAFMAHAFRQTSLITHAFRTSTPEQLSQLHLEQIKVAEKLDSADLDNVKFIIALGLTGPDAAAAKDGTIAFRPADPLTRQEAAAWFTKFIPLIM